MQSGALRRRARSNAVAPQPRRASPFEAESFSSEYASHSWKRVIHPVMRNRKAKPISEMKDFWRGRREFHELPRIKFERIRAIRVEESARFGFLFLRRIGLPFGERLGFGQFVLPLEHDPQAV